LVVLVAESGGLVARDARGSVVRTLVAGALSRARYEPRVRVAWFLRAGRLEALDLTATAPPVVVVDGMPDIDFDAGPDADPAHPSCGACVIVAASPGPSVTARPDEPYPGYPFHGDEATRFARDAKLAVQAQPTLTGDGARLLARLATRTLHPARELPLGDATWPPPASARKRTGCDADCGRGFELAGLHRVLLVTGRVCDCALGRCRSTCVHYDPERRRYARPSSPAAWSRDAAPEPACHPTLDASGTAYILDDHSVCTARGCAKLAGRILGWLQPGLITASVHEDLTTCPE